jgi:hypothetical protein
MVPLAVVDAREASNQAWELTNGGRARHADCVAAHRKAGELQRVAAATAGADTNWHAHLAAEHDKQVRWHEDCAAGVPGVGSNP